MLLVLKSWLGVKAMERDTDNGKLGKPTSPKRKKMFATKLKCSESL